MRILKIILVIILCCISVGSIAVSLSMSNSKFAWGSLFLFVAYFLYGMRQCPEEKRFIIELFSAFNRVGGPGFVFVWPFFESVREIFSVQQIIKKLFPNKEPGPEINFIEGGSAILSDVLLHVKVKGIDGHGQKNESILRENIKSLFYEAEIWLRSVAEIEEGSLRATLQKMKLEEIENFEKSESPDWHKVILNAFPGTTKSLELFPIEVVNLTISEFIWSEDVVNAREAIMATQRDIKKAEYEKKTAIIEAQKAKEVKVLAAEAEREASKALAESTKNIAKAKMEGRMEVLTKDNAMTAVDAAKAVAGLEQYEIGVKGGAVTHVIGLEGGGNLPGAMAAGVSAFNLTMDAIKKSGDSRGPDSNTPNNKESLDKAALKAEKELENKAAEEESEMKVKSRKEIITEDNKKVQELLGQGKKFSDKEFDFLRRKQKKKKTSEPVDDEEE